MIPTWIASETATPSATNLAFSSSNIFLAALNSLRVATIGNIIRKVPYTLARNKARNCVLNIASPSSDKLIRNAR